MQQTTTQQNRPLKTARHNNAKSMRIIRRKHTKADRIRQAMACAKANCPEYFSGSLFDALAETAINPCDGWHCQRVNGQIQAAIALTRTHINRIETELNHMQQNQAELEQCRSLIDEIATESHCYENIVKAVSDLDPNQTAALLTLATAVIDATQHAAEPFDGNV